MTMMVRDLAPDERPREKLINSGAGSLSDAELLAILLRTGTKTESVLEIAEKILAMYRERSLVSVLNMTAKEFSSIKGIGEAKAATILAAVELGKRFYVKAAEIRKPIATPEEAAEYAMARFRHETRENFAALLLDVRNRMIAMPVISVGTLTASLVHPREVFKEALRHSAASIVLIHNHPSGDPRPSGSDMSLTKKLMRAGELMDIPVTDHIIVGGDEFFSFRREGYIE